MSKSILSNDAECFICGTTYNLHKHHCCHGTGKRTPSEREGLWVYLCAEHHNMSKESVHFNTPFDITLKKFSQYVWQEKNNKTKDDFIKVFGKSYL